MTLFCTFSMHANSDFKLSGISDSYQLDLSISVLGVVGC